MRASLGRPRRPGRCHRKPGELACRLPARRGRPHPRHVQDGAGRPYPPVHRGQDRRRALCPGRHVLQGIPGAQRLGPSRRGPGGVQPAGQLRSGRRKPYPPDEEVRRFLHGRGSTGEELRPGTPVDPEHVQRQPGADDAQDHGPGLGWRPAGGRQIRPAARPARLRGDVRAVRDLQRRGRRPSTEPDEYGAGLQRLRAHRRNEVPGLDPRNTPTRGRSAPMPTGA